VPITKRVADRKHGFESSCAALFDLLRIDYSTLASRRQYGKIKTMLATDSVLLAFLAVAAVIHIAGIAILGFLLRESLRITRAVGAFVIQEEEKTCRLFQR
jgi:hypothetical protein